MQVVANTPFEAALARRPGRRCGDQREQCRRGRRIGRHDRRLHRQQRARAGPREGLGRRLVLRRRRPTTTRGLVFGLQDVLLDQHVFQRGRIARLINASFGERRARHRRRRQHGGDDRGWDQPDRDRRGHGRVRGRFADIRRDRPLRRVRGRCRSTTSRPRSCRPAMATTWLHASRSWAVSPPPLPTSQVAHSRPSPHRPGAGLSCWPAARRPRAVLDRLVTASGGTGSKIVVIAAGYAKSELATKDAKAFAASLAAGGASATWFVLNAKTKTADVTAALAAAQGVLLTAPDPATVLVQPGRRARGDRGDPERLASGGGPPGQRRRGLGGQRRASRPTPDRATRPVEIEVGRRSMNSIPPA